MKSNTVAGDAKHSRGVVLADIVKANIPVKNGVVHLIQRPLMVVDTTVIDFLKVHFHIFTICKKSQHSNKILKLNLFEIKLWES